MVSIIMMLHRSPTLRRLTEEHLDAYHLIRRVFDRSVHFRGALMHFQPSPFTPEIISEAVDTTKENILANVGKLSDAQKIEIMDFASAVSDHLQRAQEDRGELSRLMNLAPGGFSWNYAPRDRAKYFNTDVRRTKALIGEINKLEVLNEFKNGKLTADEVKEKIPDLNGKISVRDNFVHIDTGSNKESINLGVKLPALQSELNQQILDKIFYLGWKLDPNYRRSYYLDSLKPIQPRKIKLPDRVLNAADFLRSISTNYHPAETLHPQLRRWLAFSHNSPKDLKYFADHMNKFGMIDPSSSADAVFYDLGLMRRVKQGNAAAIKALLMRLSSHSVKDQAGFLLRSKPKFLRTLLTAIRQNKWGMEQTKAFIKISQDIQKSLGERYGKDYFE